ncbi:hypothetical protein DFH11DRAFT_1617917 [Phellopilus nigrolimitatus]|nr:hypothetical protein DFH11DRAFT_1617917 [Phellopilus nigrolimitatus]
MALARGLDAEGQGAAPPLPRAPDPQRRVAFAFVPTRQDGRRTAAACGADASPPAPQSVRWPRLAAPRERGKREKPRSARGGAVRAPGEEYACVPSPVPPPARNATQRSIRARIPRSRPRASARRTIPVCTHTRVPLSRAPLWRLACLLRGRARSRLAGWLARCFPSVRVASRLDSAGRVGRVLNAGSGCLRSPTSALIYSGRFPHEHVGEQKERGC